MKNRFTVYLLKFSLFLPLFFIVKTALATCPEILKKTYTNSIPGVASNALYNICYDAERSEDLLSLTQSRAFIPLRDILARRLVNKKDWERWIASGHTDVWGVYQPAPAVWGNWVEVAKTVNQRYWGELDIISESWINNTFEQLTKSSVYADQTKRNTGVYGNCAYSAGALTLTQMNEIKSNNLISFVRTKCWESLSPLEQAKRQKNLNYCLSEPIYGNDGITFDGRYCGYIVYPNAIDAKRHLNNLVSEINGRWKQMLQNPATVDPVFLAAHAQKTFVTIHPFSDYNGRISRFIMDRILTNLGLPPPILDDMDADLTTNEIEWSKQVGQGILNTMNGLKKCAYNSTTPDCQIVSGY